jgi:hypothetical protein
MSDGGEKKSRLKDDLHTLVALARTLCINVQDDSSDLPPIKAKICKHVLVVILERDVADTAPEAQELTVCSSLYKQTTRGGSTIVANLHPG